MIYLNQAATTYPKPKEVLEAVEQTMALPPFSQFRSFEGEGVSSAQTEDVLSACREALAALFGITKARCIVLTSGATESMNRIVRGLQLDGARIAVTQAEHNAVLRCVYNIPLSCRVDVVRCDAQGRVCLADLAEAITTQTKVLFVTHSSNVTGAVNDLEKIAGIVHQKGCLLAADVSQSAGIVPIDVCKMGIDILCFTGHKGLYGPQGTGGYYVREEIPFVQTTFGGTGTESARIRFSGKESPELSQAGTQNVPGMAGLLAGVRFVKETGLEVMQKKERRLLYRLWDGLSEIASAYPRAGMRLYCAKETPVLSFTMEGLPPQDIGYLLAHGYGITVRTGLHCAPLIHEALGTLPQGTVRVSLSYFNCEEEIAAFLNAMREIAAAGS